MISVNTAKDKAHKAIAKKSLCAVRNASNIISKNISSAANAGLCKTVYTVDKNHPYRDVIISEVQKQVEKSGFKVDYVSNETISISWS